MPSKHSPIWAIEAKVTPDDNVISAKLKLHVFILKLKQDVEADNELAELLLKHGSALLHLSFGHLAPAAEESILKPGPFDTKISG